MGSISPPPPLLPRNDGSGLPLDILNTLKAGIKGTVVVRGQSSEEDYRAAIDRWSEISIKEASIVVYVEDEQDISYTIKFVTRYNLDVAVAGGRHSFHGASSSYGLIIDLGRMRAIHIDKAAKTVRAQGGCRAIDLEVPLEKEGLSVVMGHVNDTGIGGLTTGGGSGWLTGQYGNVVDNLLSARVVLADGRILIASEKENADLFWGIRGGGSNFGICSEFTYRVHDQGDVFFGALKYSPQQFDQTLAIAPEIYSSICASGGKFQAWFMSILPPGSSDLASMWVVFYDGPESKGRELVQPLYELGPMVDTTKMVNYASCSAIHKQFHPVGDFRRHAMSVAQLDVPINTEVIKHACRLFKALLYKYGAEVAPSQLLVELQSPHVSKSVPSDAMAYPNRYESISLSADLKWRDPALDQDIREDVKNMIEEVRRLGHLTKNGWNPKKLQTCLKLEEEVTVYANYSGGDDKVASVFGNNLPRLRELKKKYDPDVLFDKWYCIEPAQ